MAPSFQRLVGTLFLERTLKMIQRTHKLLISPIQAVNLFRSHFTDNTSGHFDDIVFLYRESNYKASEMVIILKT